MVAMDLTPLLRATYEDLHAHPELSGEEHRTAGIVTEWLTQYGYDVHEDVGGTGVVGVLRRGDGPVVMVRADMDALPVEESTGLPYASTVPGVMHACGHDVHVTCLLGAAAQLAADDTWTGMLITVFQPAEETVSGAEAMVADGLLALVPRPDVVLGQHVAPLPAGLIGLRSGPAFAASDALKVTLFGRGGHGSRPEATIDPVVMAAATILRLQTVVARELAGGDTAVLTVGAINAGTKANVIPDSAELLINTRSYDERVRAHLLASIQRIISAEAAASGATTSPTIELLESTLAVVNDAADLFARAREGEAHDADGRALVHADDARTGRSLARVAGVGLGQRVGTGRHDGETLALRRALDLSAPSTRRCDRGRAGGVRRRHGHHPRFADVFHVALQRDRSDLARHVERDAESCCTVGRGFRTIRKRVALDTEQLLLTYDS